MEGILIMARTYPIGICLECGDSKPIMAKGLCGRCYGRLWARKKSGGVSRQEYNEKRAKEKDIRQSGVCKNCGESGNIQSLELCPRCYKKTIGTYVTCVRCGNLRKHAARGLCSSCYVNTVTSKNKTKKIVCAICGKKKIHKAKGLCTACYRREHKKTWKKLDIVCSGCHQIAKHEANGLCSRCYFQSVNGRKYNQIRNAKKRGLEATLTDEEWNDILNRYNHSCAYCGTNSEPLHQEHWIPLSRGGNYTADNIVPACKRCNSRKHTMTGEEFLELLQKEKEYAG